MYIGYTDFDFFDKGTHPKSVRDGSLQREGRGLRVLTPPPLGAAKAGRNNLNK
jgi:hypothetical protein